MTTKIMTTITTKQCTKTRSYVGREYHTNHAERANHPTVLTTTILMESHHLPLTLGPHLLPPSSCLKSDTQLHNNRDDDANDANHGQLSTMVTACWLYT